MMYVIFDRGLIAAILFEVKALKIIQIICLCILQHKLLIIPFTGFLLNLTKFSWLLSSSSILFTTSVPPTLLTLPASNICVFYIPKKMATNLCYLCYCQAWVDIRTSNKIKLDMQWQQAAGVPSPLDVNPEIEYEQCPHCSRNFFKGKLQFHLKLCNATHPMLLSPKKTPKLAQPKFEQNEHSLFSNQEKKCPVCSTRLPAFLFNKHVNKCNKVRVNEEPVLETKRKNNSTDINFKEKEEVVLPAIKKIEKEPLQSKKPTLKDVYMVKLRDQLRCLRKAEQINEVECSSCGRFFSKAASLRHVPICEQIKLKEKYDSLLKRRKKTSKVSIIEDQRSKSCEKRKKAQSCLQVNQSEFKIIDK